MPVSIILHIANEDPVLGEVDELPEPTAQMVKIMNPRRRDGKELHYLAEGVVSVIWPMHRMNFIQILPSEQEEEIIGFVRE